jgi:AAA domain
MRIAVSGTHCSGKTTLIEDFLAAHRHYLHEPEPYEWLDESSSEPSADDFYRQLEISVERLGGHAPGANVIAERSPVDFLAYLLALTDLGRSSRDCELASTAVELAAAGMANIDLLVVLQADGIDAPEDEDPELREAMNERLLEIVTADPYAFFTGDRPRVAEIAGTRAQRLAALSASVSPRASTRVV